MIPGAIFDWAKRTPDATAILYNGRRLSYGAYAELIARARGCFAASGCGGPGYALLAFGSLLDFWVLGLALRSLGTTTLAIGSVKALAKVDLPDIRVVVTNSAAAWPGLEEACAEKGWRLVCASLKGAKPLDYDAACEAAREGGHILRTSGTTGAYKMILMTPAVDAICLRRRVGAVGMNADTLLCVFNAVPWTGIGYKWAASPWLVGGATLIEQEAPLHAALRRPGITHAKVIPAMLDRILAAPDGAFPRNDSMQLIVGGGALARAQISAAKDRITKRLFTSLSSTEGDGIALTPVEAPEDAHWHQLTPGRVVEIVDEEDRPLGIDETGRLRISIDGGPAGYLDNDIATKRCFRNGFFYPGDLSVRRADGRIALNGRVDDVINVAGRKLSSLPLERLLMDRLGVGAAILFAARPDGGDEELHVALETDKAIEAGRVNAVLATAFPGFPPIILHHVLAMPRTESGKVVRAAVRAQALGLPLAEGDAW
jgi:acyl-coenzyme A synthetase/AMP-(fatty) acid ligase